MSNFNVKMDVVSAKLQAVFFPNCKYIKQIDFYCIFKQIQILAV